MGHLLNLASLSVLLLCVLHAYAAVEEEDYRRYMLALRSLSTTNNQKRNLCSRVQGQSCMTGLCCSGTLQCYWEHGYSLRTMGECVTCVSESLYCQRDSQCCGDLQCEKGNALWVDGTCQRKRTSGPCYRDGQCVNDCRKGWWFNGECV